MTLLDYLSVLKRWRAFILSVTCLCAVIVGVKGFLSPRSYSAYVSALLPRGEGGPAFGPAAGQLLGINRIGGSSQFEMVEAMLTSRRMARDVIEHLGLAKEHPKTPVLSLEKQVLGSMEVFELRAGFRLKVTSESPEMAAEIANFAVSNLDKINEELEITPSKPMVRVLDAATPPLFAESRHIKEQVLIAVLASAGGTSFLAFLVEYFRRLKERRKRRPFAQEAAIGNLEEEILLK